MAEPSNGQQLAAEAFKQMIYLHVRPYLEEIFEQLVALILSECGDLPPDLGEVVREDVRCGLIVVPRCRHNWLESGSGVRISVTFADEELTELARKYYFIPGLVGQIEATCRGLLVPNLSAIGNRHRIAKVADLIEV